MLSKYEVYRNAARRLKGYPSGWGAKDFDIKEQSATAAILDALPYHTLTVFLPEEIETELIEEMNGHHMYFSYAISRPKEGERAPHQQVHDWFSYLGAQSEEAVILFLQELADKHRDPHSQVSVVATEGSGMVDGHPQGEEIRPQDTPPRARSGVPQLPPTGGLPSGNL
jgi:hypothetical protein